MQRFENVNPTNVPAAASMPSSVNGGTADNDDDDEATSEPPTAYRKIMSPVARRAANRGVVMSRRHLPKLLSVGDGRDAFVNLMKTLLAFGFDKFDKNKGEWFKQNTDSLFDENKHGIFST